MIIQYLRSNGPEVGSLGISKFVRRSSSILTFLYLYLSVFLSSVYSLQNCIYIMSLRALRNCDWSGDVSPLRQDCRIVAAARTRRHSDVTAAILDMRHRIGRLESSYFSPHSLASTQTHHIYRLTQILGERGRERVAQGTATLRCQLTHLERKPRLSNSGLFRQQSIYIMQTVVLQFAV